MAAAVTDEAAPDTLPLTIPVEDIVACALQRLKEIDGLDRDEAYLLARLEQADNPTVALRAAIDDTEANELGFTHVPISNELQRLLRDTWSDALQLRIEDGTLVLRTPEITPQHLATSLRNVSAAAALFEQTPSQSNRDRLNRENDAAETLLERFVDQEGDIRPPAGSRLPT